MIKVKDWEFKALGCGDSMWNENVKNSSGACSTAEMSFERWKSRLSDPGEVTITDGSVLRAVERTTARPDHRIGGNVPARKYVYSNTPIGSKTVTATGTH